jgi:hypothetical protein
MEKNEIFLTVFLYILLILISSSKPLWGPIGTLNWVKALEVQLQEPVIPGGEKPVRVMAEPVHWAGMTRKKVRQPAKELALPLVSITTVNQIHHQEETSKS